MRRVRWLQIATRRQWLPFTVVSDRAAIPASCNRNMISMFNVRSVSSCIPPGMPDKAVLQ